MMSGSQFREKRAVKQRPGGRKVHNCHLRGIYRKGAHKCWLHYEMVSDLRHLKTRKISRNNGRWPTNQQCDSYFQR